MAQSRESLSAQSKRRTNYLLLAFGLLVALLFVLAWCRMRPEPKPVARPQNTETWDPITDITKNEQEVVELPKLSNQGDAQLVVTPMEMVMTPNVVIGSEAEAPLIVRAKNAPILLLNKNLANLQENGFELSGSCMEKNRLETNEECVINVSWKPQSLRNIQNSLVITWREDNHAVLNDERTTVMLKAQSTDSKDCVICESKCDEDKVTPQEVINSKGEVRSPEKGEERPDTGYGPGKSGEVEVWDPERIPLNLKNEVMGRVTKARDVIDFNGKSIGRLLGDDTIVDPAQGKIIGKAIPKLPAMNEHGHIFGKMVVNDKTASFVDAKGKVVGFARVDGQVVDEKNTPIGFLSPWGAVVDYMGNFIGITIPDKSVMAVVKGDKQVATMRPMGFAINEKGELIGGIVPKGIAIGANGRTLGMVSLNGEVKDSFEQTVGHVLLDGAIVNEQMEEIGSVVRQGAVINEVGKPIGYVNSEGNVLNFKANPIGLINSDGTAFAHKKFVGTLMPLGLVTQGGCSHVGSVYPDGNVMDTSLKLVGHVTPEGKVFNNKNQEKGMIVPWGTAIAPGCRLLGLISLNGDLVSPDGIKTGCVNPDKTVQNLQGETVGEVTPLGGYVNTQNQVIGRIRLDGQIMDNKGQIIGCVYEKQIPGNPLNPKGIVVDENGVPVGNVSVGNKAYDEGGNWLGDAYFNGWVIGDKGQLKGMIPSSGTVFSDEGKIVGYYNQLTGVLKDNLGVHLGRVLPGLTVVNLAGTEILGKLIPEGTSFIGLDGTFLGTLDGKGALAGGTVENYKIHADGRVTDGKNHLIGGQLPMGPVLSGNGKYVGLVGKRGELLDHNQVRIGRVLTNGLAISEKNQIMGQVFPSLSVGISTQGFVGSIEPKMSGKTGDISYQLQASDTKGNSVGIVSGTKLILGSDNTIAGRLVSINPFVNGQGKLLGWVNFQGEVNAPDGRLAGTLLPSGSVLDIAKNLVGTVVSEGVVVDAMGEYVGSVNSHGTVLSAKGELMTAINGEHLLYSSEGTIVGQLLKPGLALDMNGRLMGWTRADGQIENGTKVVGSVGLDGHVFDANGQIIGRYLALGMTAFNEAGKSAGFVNTSGEWTDPSGVVVANATYAPYVSNRDMIIALKKSEAPFVSSLESGKLLGVVGEDASVRPLSSDKTIGSVKLNRTFVNTSHQLEGAMIPSGIAITPTLGLIGALEPDGQIYNAGKKVASVTGTGLVYSTAGKLIGGVYTPGVLIDKKGLFAATTSGTPSVFKSGVQIGHKMAFRSALSTDNGWVGNVMLDGGIVDDKGQYYGTIMTTDGTVVGNKNTFAGRVLPDGSVAGVPEKAVFNTMPYAGHTIQQGIPVGLNQGFRVVGKTTVMGDVVDDSAKKLFRIIDNAYVVNKAGQVPPVVARVFPIISAVNNAGEVLGVASADGTVLDYQGNVTGRVDNAGLIRLNDAQSKIDELRIQGLLIPEGLVVNDCKIMGQTAYDGRVINGQGAVVGRIGRDLWAVDANGIKLGRVVRNNEPCIKGKEYIGRTLPDSTVVDLNGVEIGCATNSGEMLGPKGETLCKIVERGVIIDPKTGEVLGWTTAGGTWTNGTEELGVIDETGDAYNWNGELVGTNISSETMFFNPEGKLEYTQRPEDDMILNPQREPVIKVPPMGPVTDPWNNPLPSIDVPNLPGIGYLKDCDLVGYDGQKIASLKANGNFLDENGNLLYMLTPEGQVYEPNGNPVERFRGLDIKSALKQCGMVDSSKNPAGRQISIGNRIIKVGPDGTLEDEDGMIIGYLGGDGRPYTFDNKLITPTPGRKPPVPEPFKPTPQQIDDFTDKLVQKRKSMRESFGKGILTISKEMEARAKPKKDKDWGLEKSVSTWPVDMSHVILKGKAIPAVLARSIDSRYADVPAIAIVETNIYGEEGRNILIPAGSRLIGSFGGGAGNNGVAKLQISWERLIRPDGVAFNLNGSNSGDAQGRGGVAAYLDEQLWNKYGTSLLSTLATSAVAYMMATNDDISTGTNSSGQQTQTMSQKAQAMQDARKNFIDTIGDILDDMIDRSQMVPPVVYVPSGTRLTVFPSQDLWLRSVEDDVEAANKEYGEPSTSAGLPNVPSWADRRKQEREDGTSSGTESNSNSETAQSTNKETEEPLYNGMDRMPDISERKVEPVKVEEEPLF